MLAGALLLLPAERVLCSRIIPEQTKQFIPDSPLSPSLHHPSIISEHHYPDTLALSPRPRSSHRTHTAATTTPAA